MKISERISERNNNFDVMRFVAASLVIFSHSFVLLTGIPWDPYLQLTGYDGLGSLAVNIFFVISGFLITKSWVDGPKWNKFLKKRILRIFPALFVVVFFTVFVLGPLVTSLTVKRYFSNAGTYDYLMNAALQIRYFLPGVFDSNPFKGGINGSLWTLPVEFFLYLSVLVYGSLKLFKFRIVTVLTYFLLIIAYFLSKYGIYNFHLGPQELDFIRCSIYFSGGSLFYLFKEKIQLNGSLFLVSVLSLILTYQTIFGVFASYLFMPYIILFIAFYRNKYFEDFASRGDYSYGMYIYAFPVQATLVHFFQKNLTTPMLFLSAFVITYFLAWISWHCVEKQFLKLKNFNIRNWNFEDKIAF